MLLTLVKTLVNPPTFTSNFDQILHRLANPKLGMAIPQKISFLGESRNRGMVIYHSSGIEEDKIYSSGSSGISGNEVFLNLHDYYKKSQYNFFNFTQFSKILCEISNFLTYFDCPH